MAAQRGAIKLGMHLSVGDGAPTLVADIDVPMSIAFVPYGSTEGAITTDLKVTVDHVAFCASLAEQLHALADALKVEQAESHVRGFAEGGPVHRSAFVHPLG